MTLLLLTGLATNRECLILKALGCNLLARVIVHIEDVEMLHGSLLLARHMILVGLQCGTGLSQGVNYPQFLHWTFVRYDRHEVA